VSPARGESSRTPLGAISIVTETPRKPLQSYGCLGQHLFSWRGRSGNGFNIDTGPIDTRRRDNHAQFQQDTPLEVPIPDVAYRVLGLYWRQVTPFEGEQLRQSTQTRARIPQAALNLRAAAMVPAPNKPCRQRRPSSCTLPFARWPATTEGC
jgi:hypothetical protein